VQSSTAARLEDLASQRREDNRSEGQAHGRLWPDVADRTSGVRARKSAIGVDPSELVGGQYRLLGPIGESCYGRAIRAEHVSSGREVALHMIADGTVSERVLARELPLAIAKCALLSHPNVVTLHGFGRADGDVGAFYVVTDALEGISLADYLHTQGEISLENALSLGRQIGRALRAAHKLNIVHGDLRPANVRVSVTDDGLHVRVMGFGKIPMSRSEDEPTTGVRGLSAPTYAAPELLAGEPLDPRADVYALGAILFRMIAGVPPFTGATPAAVLQAHKHAPVPSLRERVGESVSPELDALIQRCLAKSKHDRFPDVVAFMTAMRILTVKDGDFLSRDVSEVSSLAAIGAARVNSILPTLPPLSGSTDTTGRMTPLIDRAEPAVDSRTLRVTLAMLVGLFGIAAIGAVIFELLWR